MIRKFPDLAVQIEKTVAEGHNYIDAIIKFADDHKLEVETVAAMIKNNRKLKLKLKSDAQSLHMLKDKNGSRNKSKVGRRPKKRKVSTRNRSTKPK